MPVISARLLIDVSISAWLQGAEAAAHEDDERGEQQARDGPDHHIARQLARLRFVRSHRTAEDMQPRASRRDEEPRRFVTVDHLRVHGLGYIPFCLETLDLGLPREHLVQSR